MTKAKAGKQQKSQKTPRSTSSTASRAKPKPKQPSIRNNVTMSDGNRWLRLLADPCNSSLARPCFGGTSTGYLARTTNFYTLTGTAFAGLTAGAITTGDFLFQYSPNNLSASTGVNSGGGPSGGNVGCFATGLANLATNTAIVNSYRAVASCIKWIPSGAYSVRSGLVGMGYAQATPWDLASTGQNKPFLQIFQMCGKIDSNGSCEHQVRWLPTDEDQDYFTSSPGGPNPQLGVNWIALRGVDATATSATNVVANGSVEITTVWEWIPVTNNAITTQPTTPPSESMNSVFSRISDIGRFIYQGLQYVPPVMKVLTGGTSYGMMSAGRMLITGG